MTDERGHEHLGIPIKFQNEPGKINFSAPDVGADNEAVARELGYSDDKIKSMRSNGAFG